MWVLGSSSRVLFASLLTVAKRKKETNQQAQGRDDPAQDHTPRLLADLLGGMVGLVLGGQDHTPTPLGRRSYHTIVHTPQKFVCLEP